MRRSWEGFQGGCQRGNFNRFNKRGRGKDEEEWKKKKGSYEDEESGTGKGDSYRLVWLYTGIYVDRTYTVYIQSKIRVNRKYDCITYNDVQCCIFGLILHVDVCV